MKKKMSTLVGANYYSTHNALNAKDTKDSPFWVWLEEIQIPNRRVRLDVFPFYDTEVVKRLLIRKLRLSSMTNINDLRIFYKGAELPNRRPMFAFADIDSGRDIKFFWSFRDENPSIGLRLIKGLKVPPERLDSIMSHVRIAFYRGAKPKLTLDGTGGTYMLSDTSGRTIGVFKPQDEEAFAPNNPRGYKGQMGQSGFRAGVPSGEGAVREVAAFFIDAQYKSFAGVPQTTMAEMTHSSLSYNDNDGTRPWKEGAFQEFINAKESASNYNCNTFAVEDVQRIGILDLYLMNLDRNEGNILVKSNAQYTKQLNAHRMTNLKGGTADRDVLPDGETGLHLTPEGVPSKYTLIPIDHGLVLPDVMDVGDIDLAWIDWPHAMLPFGKAELKQIDELNPDKDAARLKRNFEIRPEYLRTMRVSGRLLKIGKEKNLNLSQIAKIACRNEDLDQLSELEKVVKICVEQAYNATEAISYMQQNSLKYPIDLASSELMHIKQDDRRCVRFHDCDHDAIDDDESSCSSILGQTKPPFSHVSTSTESIDSLTRKDSVPKLNRGTSFGKKSKYVFSSQTGSAMKVKHSHSSTGVSNHAAGDELRRGGESMGNTTKSDVSTASLIQPGLKASPSSSKAIPVPVKGFGTGGTTRRLTDRLRGKASESSCWNLFDHDQKQVVVNWENPTFERLFFECLNRLLDRRISEIYGEGVNSTKVPQASEPQRTAENGGDKTDHIEFKDVDDES
eukprot:GHVO01003921.1.p1 GENE.GHVO01003921.1~~GHVO01003921.1.p1  ORF type:complete len:733 (+),score=132.07 GHVO01003921.1:38-2236(+)